MSFIHFFIFYKASKNILKISLHQIYTKLLFEINVDLGNVKIILIKFENIYINLL